MSSTSTAWSTSAYSGFRVLRQPPDARADFPVQVLGGLGRIGQFPRERGQRPLLGPLAPMAVDCGIPEHPVEPRHQPFVRHVRQPIQVARERLLQEVFGERPVANPPLEEPQEGPVVLDEHAFNSGAVVGRVWLSGARLAHYPQYRQRRDALRLTTRRSGSPMMNGL